jgi:hypothetical protein
MARINISAIVVLEAADVIIAAQRAWRVSSSKLT